MSVVRIAPRRRYTNVPSASLEDERLSWKARGLLAYLLSKPDGWQVRSTQLQTAGPDGRDSVRAGLRELEACGYLVRERVRDEHGRLSTVSTLYDAPTEPQRTDPTDEGVSAGHTDDGKTDVGSPDVGEPVALVTTDEATTDKHSSDAADEDDALPTTVTDLLETFVAYARDLGHPVPERGTQRWVKWGRALDLLVRRGSPEGAATPVDADWVAEVIDAWAQDVRDDGPGTFPGWAMVCRSPAKLRERWRDIEVLAQRRRNGHARRRGADDTTRWREGAHRW